MGEKELYLVTGGAGFIGSHIAEALVKRGDRVRVLDNLITGRRENLSPIADRIEFIEGDIRDYAATLRAAEGASVIFHQAAVPSVPRSVAEPALNHDINVNGTFNVLMAAREARARRVVYAASSSAYGDTETLPKQEEMSPSPLSLRGGETLRRILLSGLHAGLQSRDRFNPLFQRLRAAPGPVFAVFRRDLEIHHDPARGRCAGDLRRRRAVARFHVRLERGRREPARGRIRRSGRPGHQPGDRREVTLNQLLAELQKIIGSNLPARYEEARAGRPPFARRHLAGQRPDRLPPSGRIGRRLRRTVEWYRDGE